MSNGIIIQARTGSTRLHNKILLPFYKGKRIIDILIENIRNTYPDKVTVLATTSHPQDDVLARVASEAGIHCFRGDEDDVLNRFISAADTYEIDKLVRVCSDNPFLRVDTFADLFDASNKADYVAYGFADGRPTIKSHLGFFSELTSTDALKRIAASTSEKLYHEHVTNYMYTHPGEFTVHLLPLPKYLEARNDLRFTLDTPEDFRLLQELYATFKEETDGTLESLIKLVDSSTSYQLQMKKNIAENEK